MDRDQRGTFKQQFQTPQKDLRTDCSAIFHDQPHVVGEQGGYTEGKHGRGEKEKQNVELGHAGAAP